MSPYKKFLLKLSSLKITLACMVSLFLITIIGTLAQVNLGIYYATQKYFTSFWIYTSLSPSINLPIFPGGTTIGLIMMANLTAAMITKFKFTKKKIGLWLSHFGLILLLAGAGLTAFMAIESQMSIEEGEMSYYSVDTREVELAIIDPSSPNTDTLISIPESLLKTQEKIDLPDQNLRLKIKTYYTNSKLLPSTKTEATKGIGSKITPTKIPMVTHDDYRNITSLIIEFKDHGTYLFSTGIDALQELKTPEKTYLIALRHKRHYNPYSIKLIDFKRDLYPGTEIPHNFSSDIKLIKKGEIFSTKIHMNHPLRYGGKTYYQASFLADEKTSIFQVVENPSWTIPYISCTLISLGLLIHFLILLLSHLKKTPKTSQDALIPNPKEKRKNLKPTLAILGLILIVLLPALKPLPDHLNTIAKLPVQEGGRIKPLDSIARTSIVLISGKQKLPDRRPPIQWLVDVISHPEKTDAEEIFLIENPQLFAHIDPKYDKQKYRVSYNFLKTQETTILKISEAAEKKERPERTQIEKEFLAIRNKMTLYLQLKNTIAPENTNNFSLEIKDFKSTIPKAVIALNNKQVQSADLIKLNSYFKRYQALKTLAYFNPIPTEKDFISTGEALLKKLDPKTPPNPVLDDYITLQHNPKTDLSTLKSFLNSQYPNAIKKANFEYIFNKANLFYSATLLYILATFLVLFSWLKHPKKLQFIAEKAIQAGLILHSTGLISRMLIGGRPPVTNLYSSAVFVGWGAILIALFLEKRYKNSIGTLVSGIIGAITLIIAHHLSLAGDTLEMMQAVLDSNFWLATHVIIITLGYSTVFLAGLLAHIYVLKAFLTKSMTKEKEKATTSMIYGVLCFALLLSFVGTVLGGIWADQSWGRFWGWDPKENGAILIVLWVAIILHARMAGFIKTKGLMAMSIIGNIICSFSWFGVNLLGIGLHSYGFMEKGFFWLSIFWATQLILLIISLLPQKFYNSKLP